VARPEREVGVLGWLNSIAMTVWGEQASWSELLGFATGIACVVLVVREHIANWPTGIVNVALLMIAFWTAGLYADAGLQIVYVVLGLYGWSLWRRRGELCDRLSVVVAPSRRESIPLDLRCAWLRSEHPDVHVVGTYDDTPIDYDDPDIWAAHVAIFQAAIQGASIDAVFSSESYGPELARRFGAVHVSVDPPRAAYAVSGTAVRADPIGHWHDLSASVRAWLTRRVIVIGAESTGTTTIAAALADHYRARGGVWSATQWVPEYGRELTARKVSTLRTYCPSATVFELAWSRSDFVDVATVQNAMTDGSALIGSPVLFGDTDAFATAVWEERYLGDASADVVALRRRAHLYLLTTEIGVPFRDDGLRDGAHLRTWMTSRFRDKLAEIGVPVVELVGPHEERLATAAAAIDQMFAQGWSFAMPLLPETGSIRRGSA
jgi:HTH-type transcriptional regulator, transcriptional repressor of NAD biosynthesis genes